MTTDHSPSPDHPAPRGSALLEAVVVMDRLRSPGGCPWDAQQTHESLRRYLIEEAHEAAEAITTGDRDHLVEELGDVLLQVLFHARIGQEHDAPFDIDDVAGGLVAKLTRRHPHVFADGDASTPAEVEVEWERIKAAEKAAAAARRSVDRPSRPEVLDGIPATLPSLLAAVKVLGRLERRGVDTLARTADRAADESDLGAQLLAVVARAQAAGADPEELLRSAVEAFAADR
ncbi:MazG family protein [Kribbia dieselivorans]|uniref:MazG family protein n=1 Tax=Kribbia dieselivorans TaxID=331526 RepID=UPI001FE04934|nr:MazG family protein [Kribbia dieselivorans]